MNDVTKPEESQPASPASASIDLSGFIARLNAIEIQLFAVTDTQLQPLTEAEKEDFVGARLHLSALIDSLGTAELSRIADALQQHAGDLQQGIQSLGQCVANETAIATWTATINGVAGVVGKILPLL